MKLKTHDELDTLGYLATPAKDARGRWLATDDNSNVLLVVRIIDHNGHTLDYFNPLEMVAVDRGFASLSILGDEHSTPRGVIKTKNIRAIAILLTFLCITAPYCEELFVSIFTRSYINKLIRKYNGKYAIRSYLKRFYKIQLCSLLVSSVSNFIFLIPIAVFVTKISGLVGIIIWIFYAAMIMSIFSPSRKKIESLNA